MQIVVERAIAPMKPIRLDTAIAGNYALSTVADAAVGGTALLKKDLSGWHIIQQTGGAYRAKDLVEFGLSSKIARQLISMEEVSYASAR